MRSAYRSLLLTVLTTLAWMPTIQCGLAASTGDLPNTPQSKTLDPGWPREITRNGVRLVYYQPQVDEWKNLRELRARFAFVLTLNGAKPVAGVEEVRGDTHTDLERRTVLIDNIEIVDIRFPSEPAILLTVDGVPVLAPIKGLPLKFVLNSNWDATNTESWVFTDSADSQIYYLVAGRWFRAPQLQGPWTYAGNDLPEDFQKIPQDDDFGEVPVHKGDMSAYRRTCGFWSPPRRGKKAPCS
jgi:hypothetical protein